MVSLNSGLQLLSSIEQQLVECNKLAFQDVLSYFPPPVRPTIRPRTVHCTFYDRVGAHAKTMLFPVRVRVKCQSDMTWFQVGDSDQNSIIVWNKHIDPTSKLTRNHRSKQSDKRQKSATFFDGEADRPVFICGHVLQSDITGVNLKMTGIWITQELAYMKNGKWKRELKYTHKLWGGGESYMPLIDNPQPSLPFGLVAATESAIIVKPRQGVARSKNTDERTG